MKKAMERLGSLDPSDSMSGIVEAVGKLIDILEKDPEKDGAKEVLDLIFDKERATRDYYMRPLDSNRIYNSLIHIHTARDEEDRVDHYRKCLDLKQARRWTMIGDSYALLGLNVRAVKFLKRALFFGPSDDLLEEVQKTHDKAMKRVEKAQAEISRAMTKLDGDPKNPRTRLKALSLLIDLDRMDEAYRLVEEAVEENPDDFDLIYRKGCIEFGMDDFTKARETFTKALDVNSNSTNAKRAFNLSEAMLNGRL